MMKMRWIKVLSLFLVVGVLFSNIPGAPTSPSEVNAQGTPVNGVVALFNIIGAVRRRNRVYREARVTQRDMNAYYDELIDEARDQLRERELMGDDAQGLLSQEKRGQLRVYIKMYEALDAERKAVTGQIEGEKNDARRRFNRTLTNEVVGILVRSPGGQALIGDLRSTIGELKEAVEAVQNAIANNRPFDILAEKLASKLDNIPLVRNAAYNVGYAAGQKIDRLLGGVLTNVDKAMTNMQGGMNDALDEVSKLDAELARFDERERTPVSLVEEGGPLGNIRGVDRANAAVDVAAQAYTNAAIIAGALRNPTESEKSNMRDRIREQLLGDRIDRLSQVGKNSKTVVCEGAGEGQYILAMQQLGRTPEKPLDPARAAFIVCRDRSSDTLIHAALIGPSVGAAATVTAESVADAEPTATTAEASPLEDRCSLSGEGDFVIENFSLSSSSSTCEDMEYPAEGPAEFLLVYVAVAGKWIPHETPAGTEWTWQPTTDLEGAIVQGTAKPDGKSLRIDTSITVPPSSSSLFPVPNNGIALAAILPIFPLALLFTSRKRRSWILLVITLLAFLLMAQSCNVYGTFAGSYTFPLPDDGFPCDISPDSPNLGEMPGSSGQVTMVVTVVDDEGDSETCVASAAFTGVGVLKRDGFYTEESLEE